MPEESINTKSFLQKICHYAIKSHSNNDLDVRDALWSFDSLSKLGLAIIFLHCQGSAIFQLMLYQFQGKVFERP